VNINLKSIAHILGGEVHGNQVLAPGPNHSTKDRSLSVTISDSGDDIVVHSFASDDPIECKKYVREKCGIQFKPNGNQQSDHDLAKLIQDAVASQHKAPKAKPIASYDYQDRDGTLLYQVLRYEPKTFRQRRPDGKGWIWKLEGRRVVYRWPELIKYPDATVHFCEGEKDADAIAALDLCSTTIAGKKWTQEIVEALKDRNVWIFEDADEPGRKRAFEAAERLHPVATSIKIVRLPGLTGEPHSKDVSDWLIDMGHTKDELYDVCASTPHWEPSSESPEPTSGNEKSEPLPASKSLVVFPLIAFEHVALNTGRDYLVKALLPRVGLCLIWGPRKCGKSFWAMDLALHVAFGWEYRGRKVQQAGVIYLALEGHGGYPRRIEAFKQYYGVKAAPFYLLRAKINLAAKADQLCKDIEAQLGDEKPGAVFIDTLNRSLVGSESSDEDMAKYLAAAGKIEERFNCLVVIIHHCGYDESHPRGHTALSASVDVQIAVRRGNDLEIIATVDLAKDGPEGAEICSRLHPVDVGFDSEGDPIGSMVVVPSDKSLANASIHLSGVNKLAYDSLINAVAEAGEKPPASDHIPQNITVVTEKIWTELFVRTTPGNYSDPDNARRSLVRAATKLKNMNLIGLWKGYAWPCK
jgi:AAA domain-containing protein